MFATPRWLTPRFRRTQHIEDDPRQRNGVAVLSLNGHAAFTAPSEACRDCHDRAAGLEPVADAARGRLCLRGSSSQVWVHLGSVNTRIATDSGPLFDPAGCRRGRGQAPMDSSHVVARRIGGRSLSRHRPVTRASHQQRLNQGYENRKPAASRPRWWLPRPQSALNLPSPGPKSTPIVDEHPKCSTHCFRRPEAISGHRRPTSETPVFVPLQRLRDAGGRVSPG